MDTKSLLKDLNINQKKAVIHQTGPLLIIAGAGTGKTKVITTKIAYLIAEKLAKPEEIVALTFTEKAAAEMEERVDILVPYGYTNIWISTFHSFGDHILRENALDAGLPPDFRVLDESAQAIFMRDHLFEFELKHYRPLANPTKHLRALITFFSRLKDEIVSSEEFLKFAEKKFKKEKSLENEKLLELALAFDKYQALMTESGNVDYGDQIVKVIKLFRRNPKILKEYQKKLKYILVDEFQDTNYAQNELLKLLAGKPNITVVGDDDQCLPGSILIKAPDGSKRIRDFKKGDEVLTAVGKGSVSVSKVFRVFKSKKNCKLITFTTKKGYKLTVTDNHKMFVFTPRGNPGIYYVYLMHRKDLGWRLGITNNLIVRLKLERSADKILAIKACNSEKKARYFETLYELKYGIPTNCFKERDGLAVKGSLLLNLYKELDVEKNVSRLAKDLGIDLDYHNFCLDAVERGASSRIKVRLELCTRRYASKNKGVLKNPQILHLLSLETSNKKAIKILEKNGFKLTKAKKGKRLRISSVDIKRLSRLACKITKLTGAVQENIFRAAIISRKSHPSLIVQASNIKEGFLVPILSGAKVIYDEVSQIKREEKIKEVFDLEIEKTHNFIANNIVVHNSIFRFRGAAVSNILDFKKTYTRAAQVVLTQNYRSTREILDPSYRLIQHNNPDRLEVKYKVLKKLKTAKNGPSIFHIHCDTYLTEADRVSQIIEDKVKKGEYRYKDFAILYRANDHREPFIHTLNSRGIPYKFSGGSGLYQRPEVRILISFINSLTDFTDNLSFYHLATSEIYNVGPSELVALSSIAKRKNKYLRSLLKDKELLAEFGVEEETEKKLENIQNDLDKLSKIIPTHSTGQLVYEFLKDSGYISKLLKEESVRSEVKLQNIAKFFDKIKGFEQTSFDKSILKFKEYLDMLLEMEDNPELADVEPDLDAVNLLTVHKAKGLEFEAVFLVNLADNRFPQRRRGEAIPVPEEFVKENLPEGDYHLQEERRLFYVGMTRAKKELYLTSALDYGGARPAKLSQFVIEALDEPLLAKRIHRLKPEIKIEKHQKKEKEELPESFFTKDKRLNLSPHQIDDYLTCPLKFKYIHILKVPILKHHAVHYGAAIHKAIANYFALRLAAKEVSLEQLWQFFEESWISEGFITREHEEERLRAGREALRNFYEKQKTEERLPKKIEEKFAFNLALEDGSVSRVNGRFDVIYEDKNFIEISDFKTSGVTEKEQADKRTKQSRQLSVYALAYKEMEGRLPDKVSLYFIESGIKGEVSKNEKDLEKVKKEIFEVSKKIRESKFSPKPTYRQCGICAFRDICPYTETKT